MSGEVIETHTLIGTVYNEIHNYSKPNKTDLIDNAGIQTVFCVLYTLIFVLGIFGNVLVCYVVFRNKAMQTVTNLFITNLALSDILMCILAVPLTPLYTFVGEWIFGQLLCHLMPFAQGCSVYISTLTLSSIAIDRFFVIIYPFKPRMKLNTCICIIVFIWTFSLVVTCPYGLFMAIKIIRNVKLCDEAWPTERSRKIFGTFTMIMQFLLPFIIISFCYTCISLKLNDRAKSKPGTISSKREEADRDRKKRTNRMLISMVAIFSISWLPLNVINIYSDFDDDINDEVNGWPYYYLSFFVCHALAMASTCYNPFLYAWLNENFRKEFKQVLPCFNTSTGDLSNFNSCRSHLPKTEKTFNDTQESLLNNTQTGKNAIKDGAVAQKNGGQIENIPLDTMIALYSNKTDDYDLQIVNEDTQQVLDGLNEIPL